MNTPADIQQAASYFRTGIMHGVLASAAAIAWADQIIMGSRTVPVAIYDVSLAPPGDRLAVVDALAELADPNGPSESVIRALLDVVGGELRAGRRTPAAAIVTAYRLTRVLGYDAPLWFEAMALEDGYALARDGIIGDIATLDAEVHAWLARFNGALGSGAFWSGAGGEQGGAG